MAPLNYLLALFLLLISQLVMANPLPTPQEGSSCPTFGAYECSDDGNCILICDYTGTWIVNDYCYPREHCEEINGSPYCVGMFSLFHLIAILLAVAFHLTGVSAQAPQGNGPTATLGAACDTPGDYLCSDDWANILVCDAEYVWLLNNVCYTAPDYSEGCGYPGGTTIPYCWYLLARRFSSVFLSSVSFFFFINIDQHPFFQLQHIIATSTKPHNYHFNACKNSPGLPIKMFFILVFLCSLLAAFAIEHFYLRMFTPPPVVNKCASCASKKSSRCCELQYCLMFPLANALIIIDVVRTASLSLAPLPLALSILFHKRILTLEADSSWSEVAGTPSMLSANSLQIQSTPKTTSAEILHCALDLGLLGNWLAFSLFLMVRMGAMDGVVLVGLTLNFGCWVMILREKSKSVAVFSQ
ncbi:uncharacterized protein LY89DRAFT_744353 [Mollisia scopiformis]|uniref:Uncharacterized protein n=1 Tax=Mollisia scopiformis TaxID=149040 RepID=A0A194XUE4_MOLSC|nr:uncharacterized protein LY89DRAFT_744353 [Mollisia scopiformis]KUJ23833.1 hypothetical protein LY89DRAFT_744353 [Mollisia scopiformis]